MHVGKRRKKTGTKERGTSVGNVGRNCAERTSEGGTLVNIEGGNMQEEQVKEG